MIQESNGLFRQLQRYDNLSDQRRANGLLSLLIFGFGIWALWLLFLGLPTLLQGDDIDPLLIGILLSPILNVVLYLLLRRGYLLAASIIFIGALFPGGLFVLVEQGINTSNLISMALPIVAAGLLLRLRGFIVTFFIVIFSVVMIAVADYETVQQAREDGLFGPVLSLLLIGVFLLYWVGYVDRLLDRTSRERQRYDALGDFTQHITREDETQAIHDLLVYLRNQMGYGFAQYFIADEQGRLTQRVRTGMRASGYSDVSPVDISDVSILANTLNTRQPRLITLEDPSEHRAHMLPSSAFGVTIPVIIDDKPVGVIDVQDTQDYFSSTDVVLIQVLSQQIAAIMTDIARINGLRNQLYEAETTIQNLRTRTPDEMSVGRSSLSGEWATFLEQRSQGAIGFDMTADRRLISMRDLPATMQAALEAGEVVVQETNETQQIIVPIRLRRNVIGAMKFDRATDQPISKSRLEMAQNVADRLALALDNQRLLEQSREQATRERAANEIGNRLLSATDLDTLLNVAANSFNEALGAVQTYIQVQPQDTAPSPSGIEDGETS